MNTRTRIAIAVAAAVIAGSAGSARAQTVVNLTSLDPSSAGFSAISGSLSAGTSLDLLNTTTALSNGGLFGGAVSNQTQQATNQLNTIGLTSLGAAAPVVLGNQTPITGTPTVTINTIASAYNSTGGVGSIDAGTSTTINNTNAAISGGVNQIVGAPSGLNGLYSGGYGPTAGNVQVGGNQIGINTINGVGAAFAAGTAVTLSQLPGAPSSGGALPQIGTAPIIQGGALNMSTVNTLLAYTGAGAASVNGSGSTAGSPGAQTAVNTFNTATLVGDIGVAAQQKADGLNLQQTTFQSVNRAMAYSAGADSANVDPSVTNLNQTAAVGVNALNLLAGGTGATTLSGTQSNGYNTIGTVAGIGSTAAPIASNQIVATTGSADGFVPYGVTVIGGTQTAAAAAWDALASQVGATGAPVPGSLDINSRLTGAAGAMSLGSGVVALGNVGQAVSLTSNTVSAGTTAAPVAVTFGAAGFAQTAGASNIASPYGAALNTVAATTGVGAASLNAVTQGFQSANNTFQGTGNLSGALSQYANIVNFDGSIAAAPGQSSGTLLTPNGGSGQYNGIGSNAGPYQLQVNAGTQPALNKAVAEISYGTASVTGVAQTGNIFANVASTAGTIDPGAAGTVAQTLGSIIGYAGASTNDAVASAEQGNAALSAVNQGLSLSANAVSGTAGVNGSIAQSSGETRQMQPQNYLGALSAYQGGSAALANNTQTNFTALNAIASNGALGSSTGPAAFSQQSTSTTTAAAAFEPAGTPRGNAAFSNPANASNYAQAYSSLGAGGSAASNGLTQAAGLNVNAITGGTAAGTGVTGNASQTSTGRNATIANLASAMAMDSFPISPTLGNQSDSVMSGNATMLNTAQSSAQSQNTMSLAGANNGILNQAAFSATNQTTGNKIAATSKAGYAVTTGAQLATNTVNTISAR